MGLPSFHGFRTVRELGGGGMGTVFLVEDLEHGRQVALKTPNRLQQNFPATVDHLHKEFLRAREVRHENLVRLFEFHSDGHSWFFTMEYVEGTPFLSYVRPGTGDGPSPSSVLVSPSGLASSQQSSPGRDYPWLPALAPTQIERLRKVLQQVLRALLELKRNRLIHRDIKPSNVLVTSDGCVRILDFGLAVQVNEQGAPQTSNPDAGTYRYMAPEHARGRPEFASDLYSLGLMLFEALTGQHPFPDRRLVELMEADPNKEPPSPRQVVPSVPPDLDALCVALLQVSPDRRPSAEDALRRLGSDVPALLSRRRTVDPFVGRVQQLQELTEAFNDVQGRKRPVVVEVSGLSTLGKSTLVRRWLDHLSRQQGAVILRGACFEQVRVPNRALDSLARALAEHLRLLERRNPPEVGRVLPTHYVRELATMFPVLAGVETVKDLLAREGGIEPPNEQEKRDRAVVAWRDLLTRLCRDKPVVLFLDDLQWGDSDSADHLRQLLRPPDAPPLLVIVCYRTEDLERSPCLPKLLQAWEELGANLDRRPVPVRELDPPETEQLARAALGEDAPSGRVSWVAEQARDNPFLVFLYARYLQTRPGEVDSPAGRPLVDPEDALSQLISELPDDARRLLEVIAVAEHPVPRAVACQVAKLGQRAPEILDDLCFARWLRSTGAETQEEVEIIHDRFRQVVKAKLSPVARKDYHHGLALEYEALTKQTRPEDSNAAELLGRVAGHYKEAENLEKAASYFARAAEAAAQSLNFQGAVDLYKQAIALDERHAPPERRTLVGLADALANVGHAVPAAETYEKAARGADKAVLIDLKRRAAMQFMISGHLERGRGIFREALAEVGLSYPSSPRRAMLPLLLRRWYLRWYIRLNGLHPGRRDATQFDAVLNSRIDLCWAAVGLSMIDPICGAYFHTRGLLLALRAGDPYRVARAVATEAAHLSTERGYEGGRLRRRVDDLLRTAEDIAQELPEVGKEERIQRAHIQGINALAEGINAHMGGSWQTALDSCDKAVETFAAFCPGASWELVTAQRFALRSLCYLGELAQLRQRLPQQIDQARARGNLYAVTNFLTYIGTLDRLAAGQQKEAEEELERVMRDWSEKVGPGFHVQHHNALLGKILIHLYAFGGVTSLPWQLMRKHWPDYRRSLILRGRLTNVEAHQARACSAIAAAQASAKDKESLLRVAEADARRLRRERMPHSRARACLILAGVAAARGLREPAVQLLEQAFVDLEELSMKLHAEAASYHLGKYMGGEKGAGLAREAEGWMRTQGVKEPARLAAALVPGFPAS
jgi:serine/threonine protein kinase